MLLYHLNLKRFLELRTVNIVFMLHYQATMLILVIFGVLVTSDSYIEDTIDCFPTVDEVPSKLSTIVDSYCYVHFSSQTLWLHNFTHYLLTITTRCDGGFSFVFSE